MKDQQGKSGETYRADKENSDFPYFEIMDRILCLVIRSIVSDPGRSKLKEKSSKLSEQYARLSDEEEYSDINVSVNDSDVGIHDKTVTPPLLESSMAKEKVRNKRKINANISDVKKPQKSPNRQRLMFWVHLWIHTNNGRFKETRWRYVHEFFYFVSASDKRNADLTSKLMEGSDLVIC